MILLGVLIQAAPLDFFVIKGVRPDIILILVVYAAFFYGAAAGLITGFTLGLLEDILSGSTLGLFTLSKSLVGYLSGNTVSQMALNNPVNQFIMVLGLSLTEGALVWLILMFSQPNPPDTQQMLLLTVLPQALYNALLAPLVMLVAERFDSSRRVRYSSGQYSTGKYLGSYRG